jgi:hypothetical protein
VTSALIGVLGVLAGSLASVGAQLLVAWRTRHTEAIASARIIYSALGDTTSVVLAAKQTGSWGAGGAGMFEEYFTLWEAHRGALARATSAMDFHHIQVAFVSGVKHIASACVEAIEKGQVDRGVAMVLGDPHFDSRFQSIDRARLLAFKAGERWSDKVKRRLPGYKPTEVDILADEGGFAQPADRDDA